VVISVSSIGDNTVVAAVAGRSIRVTSLVLVEAAAVSITFKSGSTALSGAIPMLANGAIVLDPVFERQAPWLTTALGEAFVINLSVGVACTGWLDYVLAP
jgi:hypothetical protein